MQGIPNMDEFKDFEERLAEDLKSHCEWELVSDFIMGKAWDIYLDQLELERLKIENARLKYTNRILLLKLGTYCRSDYAALPDEILLAIFRNALPPPWLLNGAKSMPPYPQDILSVDLRTKLSILTVCKSWNRVGTELLYERVTLRRITQLPAFVYTLQEREELGALVKNVDIDCFVPRGYSKLQEHETRRMLALCPNLSFFGFSPSFWHSEWPLGIPNVTLPMINSGSSIISLEYNSAIPYSDILPSLIHLCQTLESLTLTIPATYDEQHPVLDFPKLKGLSLSFNGGWIPSTWPAPSLRRLWANGGQTRKLLDAYGSTITFLRIDTVDQQLLDQCPLLEHLVVESLTVASLTHQKVKLIDTFPSFKDPPFPTVELSVDAFPALLECRDLERAMKQLRYVPPDGVAAFEEFTHPNSVNGRAFARNDSSGNFLPSDEEDSDGDYVLDSHGDNEGADASNSDAENEGSEASSSSDSDAYITDSDSDGPWDPEEYWEVGRVEALAIFHRTHRNQ